MTTPNPAPADTGQPTPEPQQPPEGVTPETAAPGAPGGTGEAGTRTTPEAEPEPEPETFPRQYVEELRAESARYRERAKQADTLAERLHTELVRATGRLADPSDMPYAAEHLDDAEALTAAIDALLEAKPHLKSRRPTGDVGQGAQGRPAESVDLASMLRARA